MKGYIPSSTIRERHMAGQQQTYANHKRVYPLYHLFVFPILFANLVVGIVAAVRNPSWGSAWLVVVAAALVGLAWSARVMALVLQTRIIGLEERLRLARILPEDLHPRIPELRPGQLVALRFASDAEAPELAQRCLAGELEKKDDIKRAIKNWRPDTLRV
ncbi:MAG: DUF6526 family protein [Gemmatimonadaceae bacterium]|nr:DUF6526 family protein [Gemmatimonadaceae bacterium]